MNTNKYLICIFGILTSMMLVCSLFINREHTEVVEEENYEEIIIDTLTLSRDNFFRVCEIYEIQYPEIVYAQAQLESGHFSSKLFIEKNNFLGLYNSYKKEFFSFTHWSECLIVYKEKVQYKYTEGDYYQFLANLPYAEDKEYIKKVKSLIK